MKSVFETVDRGEIKREENKNQAKKRENKIYNINTEGRKYGNME